MSLNLTKRDYEILRTLVRVQLATTQSLQETFFPSVDRARKRLALLRHYGHVTTHAKGLPGLHASSGSNYWRVTESGLRLFERRFPMERVPDNLVQRTRRSSLRFFEHRNDMTSSYLGLIHSPSRDIDELAARATAVDWRGEFEVVLPYQSVDGARFVPKKIVPDATLTTTDTRYFLEVDRSTEAGKRIRRILSSYKSAFAQSGYAALFPDARHSAVLYVTKSVARAANLQTIIEELALPFEARAMEMREALLFLNAAISGEPMDPDAASVPEPGPTVRLLSSLYDACREHVASCSEDLRASSMGPVLHDVYEHLLALQRGQ